MATFFFATTFFLGFAFAFVAVFFAVAAGFLVAATFFLALAVDFFADADAVGFLAAVGNARRGEPVRNVR